MNEQGYLRQISVAQRAEAQSEECRHLLSKTDNSAIVSFLNGEIHSHDLIKAQALESCRNWIYATDDAVDEKGKAIRKAVHDLTDPHIKEIENMLPPGYRRMPHI